MGYLRSTLQSGVGWVSAYFSVVHVGGDRPLGAGPANGHQGQDKAPADTSASPATMYVVLAAAIVCGLWGLASLCIPCIPLHP